MTQSMFLSKTDIEELTGYKLAGKQIEWLDTNAWVFVISALGHPKVLRTYAEKKLGLNGKVLTDKKSEPDFSHWKMNGSKAQHSQN